MNGNARTIAALLSALVFVGVSVRAQTLASTRPNPPAQVCVNGKCAADSSPSSGGGPIKWHPGHYMASYGVVYGGQSTAFMQTETNDLNNQDAILGYRMAITWGALEPTQGNYDFSAIDTVLQRLKTAYNKPKQLVIMLWLYGQGALGQNDTRVIPAYIQQGSNYGASPVSGSYGWWGKNSNGQSTGMYSPALYYPPVMSRLIALVQALGQHLDGDPNVEALFIQEDATVPQAASALGSVDPHFSDDAWLAQLERLLPAATAAFPHTSVIMANSYFKGPADAIALEQWMAANRIAAGSADTIGQTGIDSNGVNFLSWGIQAYLGIAQYGGTDMRSRMPIMMDVEQPDMAGPYFLGRGGPWTPSDLITALNQTYHASHAFWTRLTGSQGSSASVWPALAATCAANPLTHTSYPANYPQP